jgi:hypothetical protein
MMDSAFGDCQRNVVLASGFKLEETKTDRQTEQSRKKRNSLLSKELQQEIYLDSRLTISTQIIEINWGGRMGCHAYSIPLLLDSSRRSGLAAILRGRRQMYHRQTAHPLDGFVKLLRR